MDIQEIIESDNWKKFENKLERIGALVLLVGIILHLMDVNPDRPNYLLVVGFSALAIVYFFKGFKELQSTDYVSNIFFRLYGWGLAITSVSLMFTMMQWQIHNKSLLISMGLLALSLILALKFRKGENKQQINFIFFIRIGLAMIFSCLVYFAKVMGTY